MGKNISEEVLKIHQNQIVIDGHCDTLMVLTDGLVDFSTGPIKQEDPCKDVSKFSHIDLPRMLEGGITTQVFACFINYEHLPAGATKQALRMMDSFHKAVDANEQFMQILKAQDIRDAKAAGNVSGMLAIEGAESLEGDLGVLRMFHRLGLRQVGLTWNWRNQAADGLYELRAGSGLTQFGVDLVKECNRLGIILDVAHLTPAGINDILEFSEQPIVDSHCGAMSVTEHPRNLTDEQLDGIAKNGGVACVCVVHDFINKDREKASIEDMVKHIDHIVQRIGVDHVALGSDFDGFPGNLPGVEDISKWPNMTDRLLKQGYSEEDTAKIMGGNYLRVIEQVCG